MHRLLYLAILCFAFTVKASILNHHSYHYDIYENYKKIGSEQIQIKRNGKTKLQSKLIFQLNKKKNTIYSDLYFETASLSKLKGIHLKVNGDSVVQLNINSTKGALFEQGSSLKLRKGSVVLEPLIVSYLRTIDYTKKKVNIYHLIKKIKTKGKIQHHGVVDKKIKGKYYRLNKYAILYQKNSFEVFLDKANTIIWVDWSSVGYHSIIRNYKILNVDQKKAKLYYQVKKKRIRAHHLPVSIYYYKSKNFNSKKKIFIIDGNLFPRLKKPSRQALMENVFWDKLINYLAKRGYSLLRYSFEDLTPKMQRTLTLKKKYKIVEGIWKKHKSYRVIVSIGWGSLLATQLAKHYGKIKKLFLLNPVYDSYVQVLKKQTEQDFLSKKEQTKMKEVLKLLIKKVYSKAYILFNGEVLNTQYLKELFKEEYPKDLKIKADTYIITSNYNSEISSDNGWRLYSSLEERNRVKHKEFIALNHYFYKIPYKSFSFFYNKESKLSREFLKYLYRHLRK